jgi:FdhD protein
MSNLGHRERPEQIPERRPDQIAALLAQRGEPVSEHGRTPGAAQPLPLAGAVGEYGAIDAATSGNGTQFAQRGRVEQGQVRTDDRDDVGEPRPVRIERRADRRDRAATGRILPHGFHVGPLRPDHDRRPDRTDGVQYPVDHGHASDQYRRLVHATEPPPGPAGEHNRGKQSTGCLHQRRACHGGRRRPGPRGKMAGMGRVTARRGVVRIDLEQSSAIRRPDTLTAEEPLEIRVGPAGAPRPPLAVTMRTPGHDIDLAIGFLLTEGIIARDEDVYTAQLCAGDNEPNTYNVVDVALAPGVAPPQVDPTRNFYTTSSCGVCGKASIDAVRIRSTYDVAADPMTVDAKTLAKLPDALRTAQKTFSATGGLHAAGLFTTAGDLVVAREDVGRHNAVDKVIGWAVREGRLPLSGHVLLVSGRASFELTQKASMAGIPMLAAVSAPSTLAADLADDAGLTLIGFLRGSTMNVYTRPERVLI